MTNYVHHLGESQDHKIEKIIITTPRRIFDLVREADSRLSDDDVYDILRNKLNLEEINDVVPHETFDKTMTKCITLVLIGRTGSGKSATANTILGRKAFEIGTQSLKVTEEIQTAHRHNIKHTFDLTVVDTPGISETIECASLFKHPDIVGAKNILFGLVIRIGRYKHDEKQLLKEILAEYRSLLKSRTFVIFTGKDELISDDDDMTLDKWLFKNPSLLELVKKYRLPRCSIDNKHDDHDQEQNIIEFLMHCFSKEVNNGSRPSSLKQIEVFNSANPFGTGVWPYANQVNPIDNMTCNLSNEIRDPYFDETIKINRQELYRCLQQITSKRIDDLLRSLENP